MTSVTEKVVSEDNISTSSDCYLTQTEIKSSSDENYSCEESNSGEEFSTEDEDAEFQSSIVQVRRRRNAIDFSPMDTTRNEVCDCDSLEYEVNDQDSMGKSASSSSLSFDEDEIIKQNASSCDENLPNNSCSSLYETPIAPCSEESSQWDDDTFEDTSQYKENDPNIENGCTVVDKRHYFWKKNGQFRKPLLSTDIFANDMPYYKSFIKPCHSLCNLSIVPSLENLATQESLSHPNLSSCVRPITATELLPQLKRCFAYMHGGKDLHDAPIICLPHYQDLRNITEETFKDVILYLTSIISASATDAGFVLVLDRRRDGWASLRAVLMWFANLFSRNRNLRMVLVLRPVGFFQGTISDLGVRFRRDEFSMKVTMLSTLEELHNFVHPDQLTHEFGGSYDYDHSTWIRNRMRIEEFSSHATEIGMSLDKYGIELAETELPNDVVATHTLIKTQQESTKAYKAKLDRLQEEALQLQEVIEVPLNGSILPHCQQSTESETLQNMTSLVKETEGAFEQFWLKHEEKLQQCLQLRKFEQDYREARFKLTVFEKWFDHQKESVGTSLSWLQSLIDDAEKLKESFAICSAACSKLALEGQILIENHYAVDCIAPKCTELLAISSNLTDSFKGRIQFLRDVHNVLASVEDLNCWCDRAMSLLAGQTVEKALTFDGSKQMLHEMNCFFSGDNFKHPINCGLIPTTLESCVVAVNRRREEVEKLHGKCQSNLKKSVAKRNIQVIESIEKPVITLPTEEKRKTSGNKDKSITPCPSPSPVPPPSPCFSIHSNQSDPLVKSQHVMNELFSTERVYVDELRAVVEGYGDAIDHQEYVDIVPDQLKGKKTVLLGNMEDIFRFHDKIFLTELEQCKNEPQLVGQCFIKRKDEFGIYAKYCLNRANSDQLRASIGETHPFFMKCQQKLGHRLALSAYLLKPVQRITKYQLLLQQLVKYNSGDSNELQDAVETMLNVLKSVNDSMHQAAIVGCEVDFESLGPLLMQGPMQVEHKKNKSKNIARPRFNKTVQRHVFLYEKELFLCKLQSNDANAENSASGGGQHVASSLGGAKGQHYLYKVSLKMNGAGITENVKGDACKFEVWYQNREEVYSFIATTTQAKQDWLKAIKKVLASQPPVEITSESHNHESSKSMKTKRSQSLNRKARPSSTHSESSAKTETKKSANLGRSASMGKGKNKLIKRKNTNEDVKKPLAKTEESPKEKITIKSASMSRILDDPPSLSDVDEGFDSSTALTSESSMFGCRFVVMKDRSEDLNKGEVALRSGDIVQIVQSEKEGRVKVKVEQSGCVGWAPTTCIRSLSDASSFDSVSSYSSVC